MKLKANEESVRFRLVCIERKQNEALLNDKNKLSKQLKTWSSKDLERKYTDLQQEYISLEEKNKTTMQIYYGQWLDELAMLTLTFFIINRIRIINKIRKVSKLYLYFLIIFYFVFQKQHIVFLVIFTSMQIYTYSIITVPDDSLKKNSIASVLPK